MWHRPASRPLAPFRGDPYEPLQRANIVLRNGPNDQTFYEYVPRYGSASIRSTAQHPHGHVLYDLQAEKNRVEDAIKARVTSANTLIQERRRLSAERRHMEEGRDGVQEPRDGEQAGPSRHSRSPAPSPSPPPNRRPDDVRRKRPYDPGNDDDNPDSDPSTDPDGGAERVTTPPRKRRRADETPYIWLAREHRWIFSLLDWVRPLPDAPVEQPEMIERRRGRRRGGRKGDGRALSGAGNARGDRTSRPDVGTRLVPGPLSKIPPPRSPRKTDTRSPRDERQPPGPSNPPDDESSSSFDDNPPDKKRPDKKQTHIKVPAPPSQAGPSHQPSGSGRRPNWPPSPTIEDASNDDLYVQDIPVSSINRQEVKKQEINPHSLRTPSFPGWGQTQASIDRLLEDLEEWRVDADGKFVDARGRLILDPNNQLIDLRGMRANAEGLLVDAQGRLLNGRNQFINSEGQLVDGFGRVPHELFMDLSDNEDYEENYATHPERRPACETTKMIERSKGKQPQEPKPLAQGQDQREPPSKEKDKREPPSQKQDQRISPILPQVQQEPPAEPPVQVERLPRAPVRDSSTSTDLYDEPPTERQTPSMVQPTPSIMPSKGDGIDAKEGMKPRPRDMLEYERLKKEVERLEIERALYRSAAARERQKRLEVEKQLQAEKKARDRELDKRIEEMTSHIGLMEQGHERLGGVVDTGKGEEKAKERGKGKATEEAKDETVKTGVPPHKPTNSRPKKPTPTSGLMDLPIEPNPKKSPSNLQKAGLFDEQVDTIKFTSKESSKKSSPPGQGHARPRAESREESRRREDEKMRNWANDYRRNPNTPSFMRQPQGSSSLPGAINRPVERGRSNVPGTSSLPGAINRPAERGKSRSRRREDPWEESSRDGGRRDGGTRGNDPDPLAFLDDPGYKKAKGGKSDKLGPLRMSDDEFFDALSKGYFNS